MTLDPSTLPRRPRTLVEELAEDVVGPIRGEVYGWAGVHPYRVFLVVAGWSGGGPGRGQQVEKSRVELRCGFKEDGSPSPPLVTLEGSFSRTLNGVVDQGEAVVEKLDPTYTETELCNLGRLEDGEESFYEVRQDGRDGAAPDRPVGRYLILGKPAREANALGWRIRLQAYEPSATFGDREP